MFNLAQIAQVLAGKQGDSPALGAVAFNDVVIDSRQASEGSLFVALRGEHRDGHDYIQDAFSRGAKGALVGPRVRQIVPEAVIWEPDSTSEIIQDQPICIVVPDPLQALQRIAAWWRRQHRECRVIGVTGSVGKTTTKEAIASVLRERFRTLKSEENYNNEIGLPLTVLRMNKSHERAVLEMGMYALGEIALLAEIALPCIGVVTNVQSIHLERLGSIERIAQAKAELVNALPPEGVALLNGDDPRVRAMGAQTRARRILYYGLRPDNDLWADQVQGRGLEGITLHFHWQGQTVPADLPLLGTHSVWTALAAAGIGLVEGLSWTQIITGLQRLSKPLRMIAVPGIRSTTILDDTYNAGPLSTTAALEFLGTLGGRAVAVLGDMLELGAEEEEGHRQVGRKAAQTVAKLIAVGPRARIIAEEARANGMSHHDIHTAKNHEEALAYLKDLLTPGDYVLVKGSRGMAMETIVTALREETS